MARISIHAPRVGCDEKRAIHSGRYEYFNPRTPCGVRLIPSSYNRPKYGFQSTHPVWGATAALRYGVELWRFQSTHPVWGATCKSFHRPNDRTISIHAPRVGCDHGKG